MTPRQRLKVGSAVKAYEAKPFMFAQPKPWGDKSSGGWPGNDDEDGGHYDGDISEPFGTPPGEEIKVPPATSPSSDTLELRKSLEAAAMVNKDPEAAVAMLAIEARLAEITLFMKTANRGASKDMTIKLGVLAHII